MERRTLPERLLTADELADMPDEPWRIELVKGRVAREPPTGYRHGDIGVRLIIRLGGFVEAHRLGRVVNADTGFLLFRNPDTVRAPDVAFVARDRPDVTNPEKFYPAHPDLAVEIASPGNTVRDMVAKMLDYLEAGTRMAWMIDPNSRTVTVYRSCDEIRIVREDGVLDGADVVPGFTLKVAELFED
jgi:Uma2 family endonuclease